MGHSTDLIQTHLGNVCNLMLLILQQGALTNCSIVSHAGKLNYNAATLLHEYTIHTPWCLTQLSFSLKIYSGELFKSVPMFIIDAICLQRLNYLKSCSFLKMLNHNRDYCAIQNTYMFLNL